MLHNQINILLQYFLILLLHSHLIFSFSLIFHTNTISTLYSKQKIVNRYDHILSPNSFHYISTITSPNLNERRHESNLYYSVLSNIKYFNKNTRKYNNKLKNLKLSSNSDNINNSYGDKQNKDTSIDWSKIDPIRFIFFNTLALFIAFGSNFLGITSFFLSTISSDLWDKYNINEIYPINGYRKHVDKQHQYQFLYPATWFIDRKIELAKIREQETPMELRKLRPQVLRPDVAYQPTLQQRSDPNNPNTQLIGLENISVIKSQVMPGFSLQGTLGNDPKDAAEKLLSTFIAPISSGKTYQLLNAYADTRGSHDAYVFEYIVQKIMNNKLVVNQHSISVIMNEGTDLYTFTAIAPQNLWQTKDKDTLIQAAKSFMLLN